MSMLRRPWTKAWGRPKDVLSGCRCAGVELLVFEEGGVRDRLGARGALDVMGLDTRLALRLRPVVVRNKLDNNLSTALQHVDLPDLPLRLPRDLPAGVRQHEPEPPPLLRRPPRALHLARQAALAEQPCKAGIASVKYAASLYTAREAGIDGAEALLRPRRPYLEATAAQKEGIAAQTAELAAVDATLK